MNKVYLNGKIIESYSDLLQFRITINGDNNELFLNDFEGNAIVYISIDGNNSKFSLGKNNIIKNDLSINFWNTADQQVDGSAIEIGNNNFFNGSNIVIISPINTSVLIGDGNLFAGNITVWGRNDHIIYNKFTKKRLNYDKNIVIGNSNWIGNNVTFLPGGCIPNYSVVGFGSLVNKSIKKDNSLIAGIPVKIKRKNICWSRASLEKNIDFENYIDIKK